MDNEAVSWTIDSKPNANSNVGRFSTSGRREENDAETWGVIGAEGNNSLRRPGPIGGCADVAPVGEEESE